ncbi:MAG: cyclic nucleotide-binding domain-containing protein [Treponema sp.]|jgi:CRP-like cAMP-binding protein|nr:cyclic nucleotide-binding domain-containing protein [Treponema sp.]
MPKPLQYRTGSLIYFQGDPADKIYILQNGKVSLVSQDIETGEDIRESVQPGEFFGVKSALGRYPREENAMALSDTSLMVFTVQEFEAVAMANSRIILKMLKVFSNQMRRVHKQVSKLMAKEEEPPADGLFDIGEFYLKNKRFSQAKYVFSRYLIYYPSGKNAFQATKNLEIAENALSRYGDGKGPGVAVSAGGPPPPAGGSAIDNPSKIYNDAIILVSHGKYQEAFMSFKLIVDSGADAEWTSKAAYEIGRCMFMMSKFDDSLKYLTNVLTKYPKHPNLLDAMLVIGQCHEKMGRKDQAAAFFKKIISMGSSNDGTTEKAKRALLALGA